MPDIHPDFVADLKKYGSKGIELCFNCGNCAAICSLSTNEEPFPREMMRYSMLGLSDEIKSSLKPWMCYYCGECNSDCPRQANPGDMMTALRRWLTAQYDWTGISGLLYKHLGAYVVGFLLVIAGLLAFAQKLSFNQEGIMHYGHLFEMFAIAGVFAVVLLPNLTWMWFYTIKKPGFKAPAKAYLKAFSELPVHMFTQKRMLQCKTPGESRLRWFEHFALVISYLSLLFTTVFLDWFATQNPFVIVLGYVESAVIFIVTFHFVLNRIRKKGEQNKFAQPSDWFFVIWLLMMGVTAFATRLFIDLHILQDNFWIYMFHLAVLIQWAVIIVPFGKWTHFLYRSFAMYFSRIREITAKTEVAD